MSEIRSVGKWISIIDRYSYMYIERKYRQYGIGKGQVHFLLLLFKQDGVSQDFLSKQLVIDKTSVARGIKKLEGKGYVTRIASHQDRRVNLVYLTEKAIAINKEVTSTMYEWTEIITEDFSEEERERMLQMLQRVANNAVNYIHSTENERMND